MAVENITIARPYAEAVFDRAVETDKLDLWSEMLNFLAQVGKDPNIVGLATHPDIDPATLTELMLDIAGGHLNDEGQNLIRLLVQNRRLAVLPEISEAYEILKNESQGTLDVHVAAPYAINPAQEKELSEALERRLGRSVKISSEKDPSLIGGARIQAGDLVIDGSVRGHLRQLANELGI